MDAAESCRKSSLTIAQKYLCTEPNFAAKLFWNIAIVCVSVGLLSFKPIKINFTISTKKFVTTEKNEPIIG